MVTIAVTLAGEISSGKSTLAEALGNHFAAETRSFGDVVRRESVRCGRSLSREDLQLTGLDLIEDWAGFVGMLLTPNVSSDVLIVDGVRHLAALEELRRQLPEARQLHVYVQPSAEVLGERLAVRHERVASLGHEVESELPSLAETADVVVSGSSVAQDVEHIKEAVARLT